MAGFIVPFSIAIPIGLSAFKYKDQSVYIRFPLGFVSGMLSLSLVQKYAFPSIKSILCGDPPKKSIQWMMFNTIWECMVSKSIIGWFGGSHYYNKHNIKSYMDAFINIIVPGQVYFRKCIDEQNSKKQRAKEIKDGYYKLVIELGKSAMGVVCSLTIIKLISKYNLVDNIQKSWFVHMEILGTVCSLMIGMYNIPNILMGFMLNHKAIVKMDKDPFAMFSISPRHFWKNWSRPSGEQLRYAIYKPLGGRKRPILSILAMFAYNCILHWQETERRNVTHEKMDLNEIRIGWSKGFAVMGTT
eukprot:359109_1